MIFRQECASCLFGVQYAYLPRYGVLCVMIDTIIIYAAKSIYSPNLWL